MAHRRGPRSLTISGCRPHDLKLRGQASLDPPHRRIASGPARPTEPDPKSDNKCATLGLKFEAPPHCALDVRWSTMSYFPTRRRRLRPRLPSLQAGCGLEQTWVAPGDEPQASLSWNAADKTQWEFSRHVSYQRTTVSPGLASCARAKSLNSDSVDRKPGPPSTFPATTPRPSVPLQSTSPGPLPAGTEHRARETRDVKSFSSVETDIYQINTPEGSPVDGGRPYDPAAAGLLTNPCTFR